MGLKIHTLAEIPDSVSKNYYLYILDYYNWDEPIGNTLRENFDKICSFLSIFASKRKLKANSKL